MASLLMFDDVDLSLLPEGYDAYAGYVDGRYANVSQIRAKFPSAKVLSIDVTGGDTSADCLDIEPGDATNTTAVNWVRKKIAAKASLIVCYTSASNVNALVSALTAAGISRSKYKLWSAHYGAGSHCCGPATCKLCYWACDATQFTSAALGRSLDESVLADGFFGASPDVDPDPELSDGATGAAVGTLQGRLNAWGAKLTVDDDFGPATLAAVTAFQKSQKLTVDGIVGPQTWAALNKTPPGKPAPKPSPGPVWPAGTVLREGDTGDAVKVLQAALRDSKIRGVRGITVDGDFGPQTLTSVRNLEAYKKITVDGIAGPQVRAALGV